jgi:hypothetical protein
MECNACGGCCEVATQPASERGMRSATAPAECDGVPAAQVQAPPTATAASGGPSSPRAPAASSIVPLREGRYKVQFTASQRLIDMLNEARDLFQNQTPRGDLSSIVERALALLIAERKKQRFAQTSKPRVQLRRESDADSAHPTTGHVRAEAQPSKPKTRHSDADIAGDCTTPLVCAEPQPSKPKTRHIPHALRRQVYARDAGRCCFVSSDGTRCRARGNLEFHHIVAFARGGATTLDNICLMCRAHNALVAEREYGREFVKRRISEGAAPSGRRQHTRQPRDDAEERAGPSVARGNSCGHAYNWIGSRPEGAEPRP